MKILKQTFRCEVEIQLTEFRNTERFLETIGTYWSCVREEITAYVVLRNHFITPTQILSVKINDGINTEIENQTCVIIYESDTDYNSTTPWSVK